MSAYSYPWIVRIEKGFMTGTHRFRLKRQALQFIENYTRTLPDAAAMGLIKLIRK